MLLLLTILPARADTWIVDAAGGYDFSSIQAALDTAAEGDVIYVLDGDYYEGRIDADGFDGMTLEFTVSVTLVGQSVDGVRVHSNLGATPTRSSSIFFADGHHETLVAQMTIENTEPGDEDMWWGSEVAYNAVQEGEGYNLGDGRIEIRNVVFSLPVDHPKVFLYLNWTDLDLQVVNTTVDFGETTGDVTYVNYLNSAAQVRNSILTNTNGNSRNYGAPVGGPQIITEYDDEYGSATIWGTGSIGDDPDFVGTGDYHLDTGSPAIDAGDPDPAYDDVDGTRNDMGAFGGPGVAFPEDADRDGYSTDGTLGGSPDCDDSDSLVHPGAAEVCDGVDNDCDGAVDVDATDAATWHGDADGDGFGDAAVVELACSAPGGFVPDATDCDDTHDIVWPGAAEVCDGLDNDCDGAVDEDAVDASTWYGDADGDGFGDATSWVVDCAIPEGFIEDATDCDDGAASTFPDAAEWCDEVDNDCNGTVDDGGVDAGTWYADADGDGYGDAATLVVDCVAPEGFVGDATDCADGVVAVNPGAPELCDALDVDEDCDGVVDDADPSVDPVTRTAWYVDADGDGYGDAATMTMACDPLVGTITDATDCRDADAAWHPGAAEDDCTDPSDYNCDGSVMYADLDADGYAACEDCDDEDAAVHPGAEDAPGDGVDTDCDGTDPAPPDTGDTGSDDTGSDDTVAQDSGPEDKIGEIPDSGDGGAGDCGCASGGPSAAPIGLLGLLALRRRR